MSRTLDTHTVGAGRYARYVRWRTVRLAQSALNGCVSNVRRAVMVGADFVCCTLVAQVPGDEDRPGEGPRPGREPPDEPPPGDHGPDPDEPIIEGSLRPPSPRPI